MVTIMMTAMNPAGDERDQQQSMVIWDDDDCVKKKDCFMCKEMQENFLQKKFQPFVDNDLLHDSTVSHLNIFFFTISKSFLLKRYFGYVKRFFAKRKKV